MSQQYGMAINAKLQISIYSAWSWIKDLNEIEELKLTIQCHFPS